MEENTPHGAEVSLGDYVDMLRRRKGVILQTFLLVFLVGTVVTLRPGRRAEMSVE